MSTDGAGIALAKTGDLLPKLHTYDQATTKNRLLFNWGKVSILVNKNKNVTLQKTFLNYHPYGKIKCSEKGKYSDA